MTFRLPNWGLKSMQELFAGAPLAARRRKQSTFVVPVLLCLIACNGVYASSLSWQQLREKGDGELRQNHFSAAEVDYQQALTACESGNHAVEDTASCLTRLSNVLALQNRVDQAAVYEQKARTILENAYGKDSPKLESTLKRDTSNGDLLSTFQRELLKKPNSTVEKISTTITGLDSSTDAGMNKTVKDEPTEASPAWEENETTLPAANAMSRACHDQMLFKEAESQFQRMVAIDIKSLGKNHPSVAHHLYGLGMLYLSKNKAADARPVLEQALSIYQSVHGEDSQLVVNLKSVINHIDDSPAQQRQDAQSDKQSPKNIDLKSTLSVYPQ